MTDVLSDRLLTASEVAEILRVTERYVWRLGREGALERIKPPGRKYVLFPESAVRRYLEEGRRPVQMGTSAARLVDQQASAPPARSPRPRRRRFPMDGGRARV